MGECIFNVPSELWQSDLPQGYKCTLYVGRMVGQLKPMATNANFQQFSFEIHDAVDPTEMNLRYSTLERPAEELARWENVGDLVGVVIAHQGSKMDMVGAINFTRGCKWFATGYYPHSKDKRPLSGMPIEQSHNLVMISIPLLCGCIGVVLLPIAFYANAMKSSMYRQLNPPGYRTETARKIMEWVGANRAALTGGANPSLDPGL
ncbi:MAG: hypothetical protein KF743_13210 [Fimbriimonadaceae bacterium]|nr:hypothetical protein [Fimbriimonadaceae bacterium]